MGLKLPAIGGKDSMSGTFNDIDVPPTLCSFAIGVSEVSNIVSNTIDTMGNLYELTIKRNADGTPDFEDAMRQYSGLYKAIRQGKVQATYAIGFGGILEAVSKMAFGNEVCIRLNDELPLQELAHRSYGNIVVLAESDDQPFRCREIGEVLIDEKTTIAYRGEEVEMEEALKAWTAPLEGVFPTASSSPAQHEQVDHLEDYDYEAKDIYICKHKVARPKVFIPAFPGTNCEYDSARAFERAGADVETIVFRNMNDRLIIDSLNAYERAIKESQIIMIPGGFSAGDEPEGSAKFITSVFRNSRVADAVMELLNKRDGLMLGICNGFQALVKLGLVPYGEIRPQDTDSPTLTFNTIGRHQSKIAYTRVVSNLSPWLRGTDPEEIYAVPISHGEGRFVASSEWIETLFSNGQVATQYVNLNGIPTMDERFNMNGSYEAIEGITSPDGRVFGKMAHSERRSDGTYLNVPGEQDQRIFESGVEYFK